MLKLIAVYALSCASCTLKSGAPSMRVKAFSVPSPSTTAILIGRPISTALTSAAAMIRWAVSAVMLAFWKVFSAIEIKVPPLLLIDAVMTFQLLNLRKADLLGKLRKCHHTLSIWRRGLSPLQYL